jgi:L-alanine-DL-glutamate epimerase-like enolase superfamily enzyme
MKIIGMEIFPLNVTFSLIKESFGTIGKNEDHVIIRMHTDEGVTGLGEASTLGPYYSGESGATVIDMLVNQFFPKVLEGEDPFNVDKIHGAMDKVVYGHSVAKSAVDFALYDIMSKSLEIPAYKLLGGATTKSVPVRANVGIDTPEKMAAQSKAYTDAGYHGLKVKVGLNPPEDVDRIAAIREAIGPDHVIDVDVNGAYLPKTAIWTLNKMEAYWPVIVEQPVDRDDYEGMAFVRRRVNVPIGACEAALTVPQVMRVIKKEAADFFNYKIDRSGGFFRAKQVVYAIDAAGMFTVPSEQLCFGIGIAAQAHFAVSTSLWKTPLGIGAGILRIAKKDSTRDMEGDIVFNTPIIENGTFTVPDGIGLCVTLNEENVIKYLKPGQDPFVIGKKAEEWI